VKAKVLTFPKSSRDILIEEHMYIVQIIARSIARGLPPCFELDDLISEGYIGLMAAADTFDASRKVPFTSWARTKVDFAIRDSIRRRNYTANTMEALYGHGDHVAERLRDSLRSNTRRDAGEFSPQVDRAMCRDSRSPEDSLIEQIDAKRKMHVLSSAIADLSPRKRAVFEIYYSRNKRIIEAGEALGVHPSRASQLHHEGLRDLTMGLRRRGVHVEYSTLKDAVAVSKAA
jgi:RNA polymerase sigma factor FliA